MASGRRLTGAAFGRFVPVCDEHTGFKFRANLVRASTRVVRLLS